MHMYNIYSISTPSHIPEGVCVKLDELKNENETKTKNGPGVTPIFTILPLIAALRMERFLLPGRKTYQKKTKTKTKTKRKKHVNENENVRGFVPYFFHDEMSLYIFPPLILPSKSPVWFRTVPHRWGSGKRPANFFQRGF